MKNILTDMNGKVIMLGMTINAPEPNHSDIHQNEFQGQVDDFRYKHVVVCDGDGDCFEFEPERLEIDDSEVGLFTPEDIQTFKDEWGQSTSEICANLGYDEEGSDDLLMVDYFWLEDTQQWYPIISSTYTLEQQNVATYIRF